MNRTSTLTWTILLGLALASAGFSTYENNYAILFILILAMLKFLGIAFQFMELKKAHSLWKVILCMFLLVFISAILIVK